MVLVPRRAPPWGSWKVWISVMVKGLVPACAELHHVGGAVVAVSVGAEHQVGLQVQRGKARDIVVLIGIEDHGKAPAGEGEAGVTVPTQFQLFHGKASLVSLFSPVYHTSPEGERDSVCFLSKEKPGEGKRALWGAVFSEKWKNRLDKRGENGYLL